MTRPVPPVSAVGCAWMPISSQYIEPGDARLATGSGWHIATGQACMEATPAARLMRRLGPDEEGGWGRGCVFLGSEGFELSGEHDCWDPPDLNFNRDHRAPYGWYKPVRFHGLPPDFGESGWRYTDESEGVSGVASVALPLRPSLLEQMVDRPSPEGKAAYRAEAIEIEKGELQAVIEEAKRAARAEIVEEVRVRALTETHQGHFDLAAYLGRLAASIEGRNA